MKTEKFNASVVMLPMDIIDGNDGQIEGLPRNPRLIRDDKFEALKRSIEEDPEMLGLRPLMVYPFDGRYVAIGGNMRLSALRDLGYEEAPCVLIPEGTSAKKLRAYTMKDNYGYGEWDQSLLTGGDWDLSELDDWDMADILTFDLTESEEEDDVPPIKPEKPDLSDKIKKELRVEVECETEAVQEELYNRLIGEGYTCRILTL